MSGTFFVIVCYVFNYPPQSGGFIHRRGREYRSRVVETHAGHRRRVALKQPDHFDGALVRARGRLP